MENKKRRYFRPLRKTYRPWQPPVHKSLENTVDLPGLPTKREPMTRNGPPKNGTASGGAPQSRLPAPEGPVLPEGDMCPRSLIASRPGLSERGPREFGPAPAGSERPIRAGGASLRGAATFRIAEGPRIIA